MFMTISKEDSKKAKDFIKKSQKDNLTNIVVRIYTEEKSIKFQSSSFSGEYRTLSINFENQYIVNHKEIVIDLNIEDIALEYLTDEIIDMDIYKNNLNNIRIGGENGIISNTIYVMDTIILYKRRKNGKREKSVKVDRIGFSDIRMIR